jgi:nitrite reductase/ring-hydroxylating ferredoxin subunit
VNKVWRNRSLDSVMSVMPSTDLKTEGAGVNRRGFLGVVTRILLWISALVSAGGLIRFLSYQSCHVSIRRYTLDLPTVHPVGSSTLFAIEGFVLYRDNQDFFVRSLVCPHLGCVVQSVNVVFECPCRGSRFGEKGDLLNGPATKPLRPIWLELDQEGRLVVDVSLEVPLEWRLIL